MRFAIAAAMTALLTGCGGNRCQQVAGVRASLARSAAANRGADVRVTVPYAHANAVLAGLLAQQPVTATLEAPDLIVIPRVRTALTATAREVVLQPGTADRIRFHTVLEIRETDRLVTELSAVLEVEPRLVRSDTGAELVVGFGPQHLVHLAPTLPESASQTLRETAARWVPERLKSKLPAIALDAAARTLGKQLTERGWELLRGTLMKKLGELTRMTLRLPDVPIARHAIRSTTNTLIVELETDLPVRRGLGPSAPHTSAEVGVELSGSTAAELANWALDRGHAPARYTRNLKPRSDGEFTPRFDYLVEDARHPLKVYSFQERGGCSYHKVGVRAVIAVEGDRLRATALDRDLEAQSANPLIELGAWTQYFLTGWIDRSRRVAAHTRIGFGPRTVETRVTAAEITSGELRFSLRFAAPAPVGAIPPRSTRSSRPPIARPPRFAHHLRDPRSGAEAAPVERWRTGCTADGT